MKHSSSKVEKTKSPSSVFITQALDMSWRLALVVLIPIVGGFKLDGKLDMTPLLTIVGFFIAMAGTGLVMWQALQKANNTPLPKTEKRQ